MKRRYCSIASWPPSFSIRTGFVYKTLNGASTNINPLRPYNVWDVALPRQDPGPDGVTGTPDDGPIVTVYDYNAAYRGAALHGDPCP